MRLAARRRDAPLGGVRGVRSAVFLGHDDAGTLDRSVYDASDGLVFFLLLPAAWPTWLGVTGEGCERMA